MESSSTKLNCFWGIPQKSAYVIYIITKKKTAVNYKLLIGYRIFMLAFVIFAHIREKKLCFSLRKMSRDMISKEDFGIYFPFHEEYGIINKYFSIPR